MPSPYSDKVLEKVTYPKTWAMTNERLKWRESESHAGYGGISLSEERLPPPADRAPNHLGSPSLAFLFAEPLLLFIGNIWYWCTNFVYFFFLSICCIFSIMIWNKDCIGKTTLQKWIFLWSRGWYPNLVSPCLVIRLGKRLNNQFLIGYIDTAINMLTLEIHCAECKDVEIPEQVHAQYLIGN